MTVKAFNMLHINNESMRTVLMANIEEVINLPDASLSTIDARLEELQQLLLKKANSNQSYDELAKEIFNLREKKQNIMADRAEKNGFNKRVAELEKFLQDFTFELTEYNEQLVRSYIQKITVYDDRYEVEFKAGLKLNIER